MRKLVASFLAGAFLFSAALADTPTMAGFDPESAGHDWTTNQFFSRMEDRTGLSWQFQQEMDSSKWTAAKAAMESGENLPDVLFKAEMTDAEIISLYEAGTLIDLRPLLEENAPNLWQLLQDNPAYMAAITLPDGAIAALPQINQLQVNNALWINTAWLEKLGLSMPTTAEELTEVLRAFRDKDPNGNGKKDEIPLEFFGMWDLRFLSHAFGFVANDYYLTMDAEGHVTSCLLTEENRAFLAWLHELWQEKLLDQSAFYAMDALRPITDSKAAMTYGVMFAPTPLSLIPAAALEQYSLLPPLTYNGEQIYRSFLPDVFNGTFAITAACEDPAAALRWVDVLYTEEGCRLSQLGQEGTEYTLHSDGTWSWNYAMEEISTLIPLVTIADGGLVPGLIPAAFQLNIEHEATSRIVRDLYALRQLSVDPMPQRMIPPAVQQEAARLQATLGPVAEHTMIQFITGDIPLNDDTWAQWSAALTEAGLPQMIALWQDFYQQ